MDTRKRKTALYSGSSGPASSAPAASAYGPRNDASASVDRAAPASVGPAPKAIPVPTRSNLWMRWLLLGLMMVTATVFTANPWRQWVPQRITQNDIDAAVLQALTTKPMPSPAAKAYADVMGSVVRVIGVHDDKDKPVAKATQVPPTERTDKDKRQPKAEDSDAKDPDDKNSVGTGVVIMDNGTILTNMHVVAGSKRIKVEFADGLVADADVINVRPEHDLAVLRARKVPDDLKAATMRSTEDLLPGDRVTAVGFPFGIGPSVSHGVVSGLKREFRSPEGNRVLTNLIQFDAAANPGNSGGPLVTDNGEVVGIVTAIYNPTPGRFFVGLGFAVPIENAAQAAGMPPF
jgi:serine protease DegQ